jgi:hypothetical protein
LKQKVVRPGKLATGFASLIVRARVFIFPSAGSSAVVLSCAVALKARTRGFASPAFAGFALGELA